MISKLDVLLQRCVRLAMGAEWEPSGAGAEKDVFRALVLSIVYVLLQRCVRLVMGAEREPSGTLSSELYILCLEHLGYNEDQAFENKHDHV